MRLPHIALVSLFALSACNFQIGNPDGKDGGDKSGSAGLADSNADRGAVSASLDPLISADPSPGQTLDASASDDVPRPVMQAQVVLDRLGFTPGVVDGKPGLSTTNAVIGFQEANGLPTTGELDKPTTDALAKWSNIPATRLVTIPVDFAAGPFTTIPKEPSAQAKLPAMAYASLDEKLAERFHTTVETLKALNPQMAQSPATGASANAQASPVASAAATQSASQSVFAAGQQIRVPNVGADQIDAATVTDKSWLQTLQLLGVGTAQPKASRIVVSKSKGTLRAYDKDDKLVGMYTATMGSVRDPLPLGEWKVTGIATNPKFHYNPALFWDAPTGREKELLPPGPNSPVGVAWIDLNKPHYGIHGTPNPETIGRAQSHGCVRLTNWDVARLAQMVTAGTRVTFEA
jgi:lipoprotein-anchoring transpeptidase ErfK/SrfK